MKQTPCVRDGFQIVRALRLVRVGVVVVNHGLGRHMCTVVNKKLVRFIRVHTLMGTSSFQVDLVILVRC